MRVTNIELFPGSGIDPVVLDFMDAPPENPYQILTAQGLDADDVVSRFYGTGGGSQRFHEMTLQKRTVVLRVGLSPVFHEGQSYSDLRDRLYRIIGDSRSGFVKLRFNDEEGAIACLHGFVTKLEAPQFSKEQIATITINCDESPMLHGVDRVEVDVSELDPAATEIEVTDSTASTGFKFAVRFTADTPYFEITDTEATWNMRITIQGGFLEDDVLFVSSEPGDKYLYYERGGTAFHVADRVAPGFAWPILFPRANYFFCTGNLQWEALSYVPIYWGL